MSALAQDLFDSAMNAVQSSEDLEAAERAVVAQLDALRARKMTADDCVTPEDWERFAHQLEMEEAASANTEVNTTKPDSTISEIAEAVKDLKSQVISMYNSLEAIEKTLKEREVQQMAPAEHYHRGAIASGTGSMHRVGADSSPFCARTAGPRNGFYDRLTKAKT